MLTSLSTMLQIELPHVNVLSKMDLIKQYGQLAFNLDFYTDVLDLNYLVDTLDSDKFMAKFKKLNKKICDVVSDYSLLSFIPLNIQKKNSVIKCIQQIDRANGFIYGEYDRDGMMSSIAGDIDMTADYDENEDDNLNEQMYENDY